MRTIEIKIQKRLEHFGGIVRSNVFEIFAPMGSYVNINSKFGNFQNKILVWVWYMAIFPEIVALIGRIYFEKTHLIDRQTMDPCAITTAVLRVKLSE